MRKWITPLAVLAIAEVLAGLVLRFNVELLVVYPVLLVLIPGLMDLRGDVYGAVGYRLTKALHLGLTSPSLRSRYNLVNSLTGFVVSTIASVNLSLIGMGLSLLTRISSPDLTSLLFISLFSTLVVYFILTPVILASVVVMFKRGHDPSPFIATIVTGIGDFVSPTALLLVAQLHDSFHYIVKSLTVLAIVLASMVFTVYLIREKESRDLVENLVSATLGSTGSSFGGFVLALYIELISRSPELLGVLPAFNAVIGAAMGYLGNELNIDLHIGVEKTSRSYYGNAVLGFFATYSSIIIALFLTALPTGSWFTSIARVLGVVSLACMIVYALSTVVTYWLTIQTYKHGWDPDNVVFPIMTTFVDLMGPTVISITGLLVT